MAKYSAGDILGGLFGGVVRNMDEHQARKLALEEAQRTAPLKREALQGLLGYFQSPAPAQGGLLAAAATPGATPAQPAPRGIPTIRDLAGPLAQAELAGLDIGGLVNVLDKTAPQIDVANGVAYDKRGTAPGSRIGVNLQPVNGAMVDPNDPKNVNRYVPKLPDGAVPLYDAQGNVVAAKMLDGVVQVLGQTEAAQARGRAEGAAPFQFLNVPNPDGSTTLASQADLVRNLLPPGAGRSQAPADRIRAEGAATRDVARDTNLEARYLAGQRQLPLLAQMEKNLPNAITGFAAGPRLLGARVAEAFGNDEAAQQVQASQIFEQQAGKIVAEIIKTFGANPTEGERAYIEKISGANRELSPRTLQEGIALARQTIARDEAAYNAVRGGGGAQPASGYSRAALEAEARRRGMIR